VRIALRARSQKLLVAGNRARRGGVRRAARMALAVMRPPSSSASCRMCASMMAFAASPRNRNGRCATRVMGK